MSIRRILISSDFLFTKEIEQLSNRRWFFDLLCRPIERATGIRPQTFFSSTNQELNTLDRREFFKLSNIECDLSKTQFWFNPNLITENSLDYIKQFISSDDLIIGYELTSETRSILETLNIKYIDFWLHPVRFMDDILFALRSNQSEVDRAISAYSMDEYTPYLYADKIKIQSYKGSNRFNTNVPENTALFIGQMDNDKSVCCEGKMLSILDFKSEFEILTQDFSHVLFSKHPYLKKPQPQLNEFLASFSNVTLSEDPTYHLLCNRHIEKVVSLSSSILHEAQYFDKPTEYLFKPIIDLSKDSSSNNTYHSIYNDFVNPSFWQRTLQPIINTYNCPDVSFYSSKNKIRNMLNFHWGYKTISEEHATTLPPKNTKKKESAKLYNSINLATEYQNIKNKIDNHTIISFDIFDTLLERVIFEPSDLFDIMTAQSKITNFKSLRQKARNLSFEFSKNNGEETPLNTRYEALYEAGEITLEQSKQLLDLELTLESKFLQRKETGCELLEYALNAGKKVILISDTFYDRSFIQKVLNKNNINGYSELYLSSEIGALKQSGNLFNHLIQNKKVDTNNTLHIGDNKVADVQMASKHSLANAYFPSKQYFMNNSHFYSESFDAIGNGIFTTTVKGLVSRKIFDKTIDSDFSISNGHISQFGYTVLGPTFFAFTKWILDEAINYQVKDIFFLSRDGRLPFELYKILSQHYPNAPKPHYIYSSRRATRVASLRTLNDIRNLLEINFSKLNISTLLKHRFGIEHDTDILENFSLPKETEFSSDNLPKEVTDFIQSEEVVKKILDSAKSEREELASYYSSKGITTNQSIAFVDIGHYGNIQKSITELMGIKHSVGLYFAIHEDIKSIIPNHTTKSFIDEPFADKDIHHFYKNNMSEYETIFLSDEETFIKMHNGTAVFGSEANNIRKDFASELHLGAIEFTKEYLQHFSFLLKDITFDKTETAKLFAKSLDFLQQADADLFTDINLENNFSGRTIKLKTNKRLKTNMFKKVLQSLLPKALKSLPMENIITILNALDLNDLAKSTDLNKIAQSIDWNKTVKSGRLNHLSHSKKAARLIKSQELLLFLQSQDLDTMVEKIDINAILKTVDLNDLVNHMDLNVIKKMI